MSSIRKWQNCTVSVESQNSKTETPTDEQIIYPRNKNKVTHQTTAMKLTIIISVYLCPNWHNTTMSHQRENTSTLSEQFQNPHIFDRSQNA